MRLHVHQQLLASKPSFSDFYTVFPLFIGMPPTRERTFNQLNTSSNANVKKTCLLLTSRMNERQNDGQRNTLLSGYYVIGTYEDKIQQ